MNTLGHKTVSGSHRRQNGSEFFEGDLHRCPAMLADKMLVIRLLREVVHTGAVAEMYVMQMAQFLQYIECAVYGRLVDPDPSLPAGPIENVGRLHVLFPRIGQHFADRASCFGDPHGPSLERTYEVGGGHLHGSAHGSKLPTPLDDPVEYCRGRPLID